MMQNLDLDLNLTPTIKEKAAEWCHMRTEEAIKQVEWVQLQQLSKDLNCLEEEIGKIRPFSRDLPLVVDILEYVRLKLKDHLQVQLQQHETENTSDSGELVHDEESQEVLNQKSDCGRDSDVVQKSRFPDDPREKNNFFGSSTDDHVDEQQQQLHRKTRRNWSRELHRRFVHVLEQLGGPHVATPKHIIKLMSVNGLTKDEVKSHLQKYRLRCKKNSSVLSPTNYPTQSTPFSVHLVINGFDGQVKKCRRTSRGGRNERIVNQLTI